LDLGATVAFTIRHPRAIADGQNAAKMIDAFD
jgi:hypothetical protein